MAAKTTQSAAEDYRWKPEYLWAGGGRVISIQDSMGNYKRWRHLSHSTVCNRMIKKTYIITTVRLITQNKRYGNFKYNFTQWMLQHWLHQVVSSTPNSMLTHWGWDKMAAIFQCIFFSENVWILLKISLSFVPNGPIKNIPALVQIMAWCRPGDKPLSKPMVVGLLTHICVTRPQWVKAIIPILFIQCLGTQIRFMKKLSKIWT